MGTFHAELVLPNDVAGLELARALRRRSWWRWPSLGDAGPLVVDAAVEACANVIDHAYEPGEDGTVRVAGDVDAAGLHLRVHDDGLKFDAARPPGAGQGADQRGRRPRPHPRRVRHRRVGQPGPGRQGAAPA